MPYLEEGPCVVLLFYVAYLPIGVGGYVYLASAKYP